MPDYRRDIEFGISLVPIAADYPATVSLARQADEAGLDVLGVQDHPYQRRFLDTMTLLPALAAHTRRLRVFPDVANLPLRHPAMLAKAAASIDVMSGGRFELGLGAGGFWEAIEAMGGPRRTPGESLAALREAVELIRMAWSQDSVRYSGSHYSVSGYKPGPPPAHPIEIWLGVYGPRALRLLGEVGDGWLPSLGRVTIEDLAAKQLVIDEAATAAGRDPAAIRRLLNFGGSLGAETEFGAGPSESWVDLLTSLVVERGFDTFVFWPQGDSAGQIRDFAALVPRVRDAVAAVRGQD